MVDVWIHVTDAADVPQKPKQYGQKNTAVCFTAVELEKKTLHRTSILENTRTREYCSSMEEQYKNNWPQYEKEQIKRPRTTFFNFSDKVAVPRGHENCCLFATL